MSMGRISGARNRDHDDKRRQLAETLAMQLLQAGAAYPTLSALAEGAGVDPGTLRHYFGDRQGVVRAAFESLLRFGDAQKARAAQLGELPAREALSTLLHRIAAAWPAMLGGMHAAGISEGMADAALGQSYVSTMLEPTLDSVEQLLTRFHARGELDVPDVRVGALALLAPVMLALLHQHQLSGRTCRPLEVPAFVERHLDGFFCGYAARPSPRRRRRA